MLLYFFRFLKVINSLCYLLIFTMYTQVFPVVGLKFSVPRAHSETLIPGIYLSWEVNKVGFHTLSYQ